MKPPNNETIVLTKLMIESCQTKKGGYSRQITGLLQVDWPLVSGWKRDLVGREIPMKNWQTLTTYRSCGHKGHQATLEAAQNLGVGENATLRFDDKTFVLSRIY